MLKGFRQPPRSAGVEGDFDAAFELQSSGRLAEAERLFSRVLKKAPAHFGALYYLGAIRHQQGRPEEALVFLRRAIACNPASAETCNALGNALQALRRHDEAIERFRRALAIEPKFAYALNNLGNSWMALGCNEEAAECFRRAVALLPNFDVAHSNLGNAMMSLGHPEDAVACYEAALSTNPGLAGVHNNLGKALVGSNRHPEAVVRFARASELDPSLAQAQLNMALARLSLGEYAAAWPDYEARWRSPNYPGPRDYSQPRWDGRADLAGKTILLYFEQGLGDTIQFARYVPLVAQLGARVILEAPKPLLRLFSTLAGAAEIVAPGDAPSHFDFHVPLLSLPLAFRTTLESIPATIPYLHASPARTGCSIGLCWAGNPDNPTDCDRSIPLRTIRPLLNMPGVRFLSLQKVLRPGDEEVLAGLTNVETERIQECADFADTAALVAGLDLVIAVDTSLAHLAGALGCPVWVLLKYSAHWAWLCDREDSPWYPGARLFRQACPGDWQGVVAEVGDALAGFVTSRLESS